MPDEPQPSPGPSIAPQWGTWKRPLTIRDGLVLIALIAVDLTGFRSPVWTSVLPGVAFVGLFVLGIVSVWLYVPKGWERLGYRVVLTAYFALMIAFAARGFGPTLGR